MSVLDTLTFENRQVWEKSIGFKSLRSIYEDVLYRSLNDEYIDENKYKHLIDFSGNTPELIHYSSYIASILNEEGFVYVSNAIGTIRKDGIYWIASGEFQELQKLIASKKTKSQKGFFYFKNKNENYSSLKTCAEGTMSTGVTILFNEEHEIQNGTSRGSKRLSGELSFVYFAFPKGSGVTGAILSFDIEVYFRLFGHSEKKGRRR